MEIRGTMICVGMTWSWLPNLPAITMTIPLCDKTEGGLTTIVGCRKVFQDIIFPSCNTLTVAAAKL